MNRITLTIASILLASGAFATATVAYGADKGDKKESSQAVHRESSHEGKQNDRDKGDKDSSRHIAGGTTRDVKLSNLSNQPIEHIDVSFSGRDAEDFRQTNNCGDKLDSGGSCTISVTFTPRTRGDKSATMKVHTSGGDESVDLSGTGT